MHYYQFHIGDYQRDTIHLDDMEDLAYRRLLDLYYKDEQPISLDLDRVAKLIRMRSHSDCIASVLREYFERTDDGWVNHRVESELQRSYAKSESAKRSAEARWKRKNAKKPKQNQEVNANAMRTDSEGNADGMLPITQDPLPKTQVKDITPPAKADDPIDPTEIANLYNEILGDLLPSCKAMSKTRKANLRARVKEDAKRRDMDWWRRYFEYIAESPFLTGQITGKDGKSFSADMGWILLPENMLKIIEGKFNR